MDRLWPSSSHGAPAAAQRYWNDVDDPAWRINSHWKSSSLPGGDETWDAIGRTHVAMFQRFAKMADLSDRPDHVLEWGVGGGANAVHFAPITTRFTGVDVVAASLQEAGDQVAAVCDTEFVPLLTHVDLPEAVLPVIESSVDLFLCFYVLELVPSPEHARRIMEVAYTSLRAEGAAIVQVKYRNRVTRRRWRRYGRSLADFTTFEIDEFWSIVERIGFHPWYVEIVPKDALDERYAYFFMTRPSCNVHQERMVAR